MGFPDISIMPAWRASLTSVVVHFNGNGSPYCDMVFVQGFRKHDRTFRPARSCGVWIGSFEVRYQPHGPDVQAFYADGVQIRFDFLQNEAVQEVLRFLSWNGTEMDNPVPLSGYW